MTVATSQALEVPGAVLGYDVRPAETETGAPVLLLIGSPMTADAFARLGGYFPDRTVVTYDPRGAGRSKRTDGAEQTTPEEHADDLHRLIAAVGPGPVDLFATSGGAVNALALVARHPEDVRTLVAHEPPVPTVLEDREQALAATRDIHETYRRDGLGPAMAKFIVLVGIKGPVPADFPDMTPDPAQFGLPTEDDGSRDDPLVGQNMISGTHYEPDFGALDAAPTRVVVAAGAESDGELAYRSALAVAQRLGTDAVTFPSHHVGFLGGEYGMQGDPDGFAAKLREVLTEKG
jgi:pimeloyl-ACP methyl ester carboxylesterase